MCSYKSYVKPTLEYYYTSEFLTPTPTPSFTFEAHTNTQSQLVQNSLTDCKIRAMQTGQ